MMAPQKLVQEIGFDFFKRQVLFKNFFKLFFLGRFLSSLHIYHNKLFLKQILKLLILKFGDLAVIKLVKDNLVLFVGDVDEGSEEQVRQDLVNHVVAIRGKAC